MSIAVAVSIATLECGALLGRRLGWNGPITSAVFGVDPGMLGLAIAAVFVVAWAVAFAGSRRAAAQPQEE
jgi:high-affinity nickel permease